MAITIPVPNFPFIPNLPGAPPVLRNAIGSVDTAVAQVNSAVSLANIGLSSVSGAFVAANVLSGGQLTPIQGAFSAIASGITSLNTDPASFGSAAGSILGAVSGVSGLIPGLSTALGSITGPFSPGIATVNGIVSNVNSLVSMGNSISGAVNGGASALTDGAALQADSPTLPDEITAPRWGIYTDGGQYILQADTIRDVEFSADARISNYPVEAGGFRSYNKVAMPNEPRVTMVKGGSDATRGTFLEVLDAIKGDLNLYNVVTPEATYPSVNVVHYDYRKQQKNGANLVIAEIHLEEVRVTATATFTNTQAPDGAKPRDGATVQLQAPTPAQAPVLSQYIPDLSVSTL